MSDVPSHTYKQSLKQHPFLRTEQDRDDRSIAVLVGHSFVRRLRGSFGFFQDVTDDNDARLFARNLRVQQKFSEVYTYSSDLNVIAELPHPRDIPLIHGANLVVLDFGSNDFTNLVARDAQFVSDYANTIREWCTNTQVHTVVQAVLPRYIGIHSHEDDFRWNAETYIRSIRENLPYGDPHIRFNKMQGMMEPAFRQLVLHDGIHVWILELPIFDAFRNWCSNTVLLCRTWITLCHVFKSRC